MISGCSGLIINQGEFLVRQRVKRVLFPALGGPKMATVGGDSSTSSRRERSRSWGLGNCGVVKRTRRSAAGPRRRDWSRGGVASNNDSVGQAASGKAAACWVVAAP